MRERRRGPVGRAAGIAEGLAATMRRLQREREPRVLVYDETGYARLVQPNGRGYERLLETAEKMVAVVGQAEAEARPRLARRGENAAPAAVGEAASAGIGLRFDREARHTGHMAERGGRRQSRPEPVDDDARRPGAAAVRR